MAEVIYNIKEWNTLRKSKFFGSKSLGFVPTMGALHEGHLSLIKKCISDNNRTIVSIFVNPTQFNDEDDLVKYPRNYQYDKEKLDNLGVDYLFYPDYKELYPYGFKYYVDENNLSKILCGVYRPGHFRGVLTIVLKLLNIIKADRAYFGEKDYQQFLLIKGMVESFFIETKIILCPTIRDIDGLALSSRNENLTISERKQAALFPELLKSKLSVEEIRKELENKNFRVDYIEEINNRRLGAVYLGKVRLIDNVEI